jgi:hypothetical protein
MLERSYFLRQLIDLFLKTADGLYGPITTLRSQGRITDRIRWDAFLLLDSDWDQVRDARDILKVRWFILRNTILFSCP